mgnify:FL=1
MKMTKRIAAMAACAVMAASSMVGMGASAANEESNNSAPTVSSYATNDVTSKLLPVPFCEQETNYYCAAATFQQVYAYYKGINNAISQSTIASLIGVTTNGLQDYNKLTDWLNRYFADKGVDYVWKWKNGAYTSASSMKNYIKTSINSNVPVIIHIKDTTTSDWGYHTSGHYLNASGYTTDYIQLTDPYLDGHNISTGKYLVTNNKLFTYCDRLAVTE